MVADALHAQVSDAPVLGYTPLLTIDAAVHGHTAEEPVLVAGGISLVVADAFHGHVAETPTLAHVPLLVVDNPAHGHVATSIKRSRRIGARRGRRRRAGRRGPDHCGGGRDRHCRVRRRRRRHRDRRESMSCAKPVVGSVVTLQFRFFVIDVRDRQHRAHPGLADDGARGGGEAGRDLVQRDARWRCCSGSTRPWWTPTSRDAGGSRCLRPHPDGGRQRRVHRRPGRRHRLTCGQGVTFRWLISTDVWYRCIT